MHPYKVQNKYIALTLYSYLPVCYFLKISSYYVHLDVPFPFDITIPFHQDDKQALANSQHT